jgi:hypothetical protein
MRIAFTSCAVLIASLCGAANGADLPSPAFSADIVRHDAGGATTGPAGKLRVWDSKTRIDAPETPGAYFLTDSLGGVALFVRPAQHLFMDAKRSTPLTRIFIHVDPHNPCRQWQAAALIADESNAQEWRCRETLDAVIIDPVLRFPTQWRSPDGATLVLENIRIEQQPRDLFLVPAGYQKLDPSVLLERIKRSDVWAPAPEGR